MVIDGLLGWMRGGDSRRGAYAKVGEERSLSFSSSTTAGAVVWNDSGVDSCAGCESQRKANLIAPLNLTSTTPHHNYS